MQTRLRYVSTATALLLAVCLIVYVADEPSRKLRHALEEGETVEGEAPAATEGTAPAETAEAPAVEPAEGEAAPAGAEPETKAATVMLF